MISNSSVIKLATTLTQSTVDDLPASLILGAVGGLLGGLYIYINHKINYSWRKKYLKSSIMKIIEA